MRRLPLLTIASVVAVGALGTISAIALSPSGVPGERIEQAPASGILVAQATAPVEISIIEPPLRPMTTWAYAPTAVTVKVGTKVTWTNTGSVVHTVTTNDGKTFDSGNMLPKATYSFTPTAPGTFPYYCKYHPWMKGTLIVER